MLFAIFDNFSIFKSLLDVKLGGPVIEYGFEPEYTADVKIGNHGGIEKKSGWILYIQPDESVW